MSKKLSVIKNENYRKKTSKSKKVIYEQDYKKNRELKPNKEIKWNFKVNDLVNVYDRETIGIIISNKTYITWSVKSNEYFVLINSAVHKVSGSQIKIIS